MKLKKIIRLIEPKDAYAYDLEQSLKRGNDDYNKGRVQSRAEVLEEIKASLKYWSLKIIPKREQN